MNIKKMISGRNILILLFNIMQIMMVFEIMKNIPIDIDRNEVVFIAYRSSILNINNVYIAMAIMMYINIKEYSIHFDTYSITRYKNVELIIKKFVSKIFINVSVLMVSINIVFILVSGSMNFNCINDVFLLYIVIVSILQILGLTMIFLIIAMVNVFLRRIIVSTGIVFLCITINDSIIRVLKSSVKSVSQMIFYKSSYASFYGDIYTHFSIGISMVFILLCLVIVLEKFLIKRDFINEVTK